MLPPPKIWKWVWNTLGEVSDEIGIEENGKYLLAYEGWSGLCVSSVFDSKKSDEENNEFCYKFAEEESNEVIAEWFKKYKNLYYVIDCGYEPTGLYGVTWALFKKLSDNINFGSKINHIIWSAKLTTLKI